MLTLLIIKNMAGVRSSGGRVLIRRNGLHLSDARAYFSLTFVKHEEQTTAGNLGRE